MIQSLTTLWLADPTMVKLKVQKAPGALPEELWHHAHCCLSSNLRGRCAISRLPWDKQAWRMACLPRVRLKVPALVSNTSLGTPQIVKAGVCSSFCYGLAWVLLVLQGSVTLLQHRSSEHTHQPVIHDKGWARNMLNVRTKR